MVLPLSLISLRDGHTILHLHFYILFYIENLLKFRHKSNVLKKFYLPSQLAKLLKENVHRQSSLFGVQASEFWAKN